MDSGPCGKVFEGENEFEPLGVQTEAEEKKAQATKWVEPYVETIKTIRPSFISFNSLSKIDGDERLGSFYRFKFPIMR
ncbi:hypothetical protein Fmac_017976 [Flemingia macrophylla]|uniref:Uncharacterized protein n=1 Tax=Flemingia macrophylla TaxID=520843 RepID=A0ABD1M5H3_9FABA